MTLTDMSALKLAAHAALWTGSPALADIDETLRKARAAGYDALAVPLRQFELIDAAGIARAAAREGMTVLNTTGLPAGHDIGSPDPAERARGVARMKQALSLARDMGSIQINGVFYCVLGKAAAPASADEMARTAEALREIAAHAGAVGVRLGLEAVNRYETSRVNTTAQGVALIEAVGSPHLTLHLDTFHMSIEEADPFAAIDRARPVMGYFELDQSHRGRLDRGSLDLKPLLHHAVGTGYRGLIGVEAFARTRLAPDHADSLAIWRDHFDNGDAMARDAARLIRGWLAEFAAQAA